MAEKSGKINCLVLLREGFFLPMSIAMRLTSQEREFVLIHNCNRTKHPRYVDCFMRGRPPMEESTLHSDHSDQCQLCCIIPTINNIIQGRGSAPLGPPPPTPPPTPHSTSSSSSTDNRFASFTEGAERRA